MTMNKYELALVINAKIEDDARTDAIEKIKALIEKFGGEITNVDEWGNFDGTFNQKPRCEILTG